MTRTIAETKTADGITIRLIDRATTRPRYWITQSVPTNSNIIGDGFIPLADDLGLASRKYANWINCLKRISR